MTVPPVGDQDSALPHARPIIVARPVLITAPTAARPSSPLLLEGLSRPDAAFSLLLVLLLGIVSGTVGQVLMAILLPAATGDALAWRLIWLKLVDAALAAGALVFLAYRYGAPVAAFGIRLRGITTQFGLGFLTLLANYAYMIATIPVIMFVVRFFPQMMDDVRERLEFGSLLPLNNLLLTAILLTFVAIHEELVFRGLMLPLLRRLVSSWWLAVVISSLIFGGLHFAQGVTGVIQVTGLGVIFSVAFLQSRSLLAVIFAHFAFNFLQFQLMRLYTQFQQDIPNFTAVPG